MASDPKETIAVMRARYRPDVIDILFLAESPPHSATNQFFYNSRRHKDGLFCELLKVAFPDSDPKQGEKVEHLRKFQAAGYFLMDATDTPVNTLSARERTAILRGSVGPRVAEIKGMVSNRTSIFIIKAPLFQLFDRPLRDAGLSVAHSGPIPFPLTGNQRKFSAIVSPLLRRLGK